MLYRLIDDPQDGVLVTYLGVYALRWHEHPKEPSVAFVDDPEATNAAALGRTTRAYDWGAETWEAAITDAYTHGLAGLADKCTDIAAEIRRQEAEHGV